MTETKTCIIPHFVKRWPVLNLMIRYCSRPLGYHGCRGNAVRGYRCAGVSQLPETEGLDTEKNNIPLPLLYLHTLIHTHKHRMQSFQKRLTNDHKSKYVIISHASCAPSAANVYGLQHAKLIISSNIQYYHGMCFRLAVDITRAYKSE